MFRVATLALLSAVCLTFAACGDEPERVTSADLEGKAFVSTSATGTPLKPDMQLSLEFEEGRLAASIGCNTISGALVLRDGILKQSKAVRTQMYCGVGPEEDWVAGFLERGARVTKLDHTLTLTAAGAKIVLRRAKRSGPPAVVGTRWTLTQVHSNAAAPPEVLARNAPTLKLTPDGTAEIFTGCNRGAGPATFADGFVTFGDIAVTERSCGTAADELEQAVLKVLNGKAAAGFSGTGELSLAKNGDTLIFAATP